MAKYKIVYDKKNCIGAGECEALSPNFWKVQNNGKAELKGAKFDSARGLFDLEIDEVEYPAQKKAASSCPSGCVKIVKL